VQNANSGRSFRQELVTGGIFGTANRVQIVEVTDPGSPYEPIDRLIAAAAPRSAGFGRTFKFGRFSIGRRGGTTLR
jgi:hypothetical protein